MGNSQHDWLALILTPGLGPVRIRGLLEHFPDPAAIHAASPAQLRASGLPPAQVRALKQPDPQKIDEAAQWLQASSQHHLITIQDPAYPPLLKTIADPPQALFVHGDPAILSSLQLAMVGTRNPTRGGIDTARDFARYLANTGLTITSGLALGIDTASHQGALDVNGGTIAIAGTGLDRVYPARNHELAHRIVEQGALVSEFPPGTRPLPQNFPRRNRIIAGLSLGTLVVEAAHKSGSLITAYKALEQSREVFAIPGSIHNPLARGCHQLIRDGAKLVETARDILEELAPMARFVLDTPPAADGAAGDGPVISENDAHDGVLQAMGYDPVDIDTLLGRCGLTAAELSSILLILELQMQVEKLPGGLYLRKP